MTEVLTLNHESVAVQHEEHPPNLPNSRQRRGVIDTVTAAIGPQLLRRPDGLRPLEEQALAALAAGSWTPRSTTFPLAEAARAHRAIEARTVVGKVVLLPGHHSTWKEPGDR